MISGPGSGGGTDGFALQEIVKENSGLSVYEQYIKGFNESVNNKINLVWEAEKKLDSGVVVSEITRVVSSMENMSFDTISLFYIDNDNLNHIAAQTIIYLQREIIPNPLGTPEYKTPRLTIEMQNGAYIVGDKNEDNHLLNHMRTSTSVNSISTPGDYYGNKWEVRQFNSRTVIFVQYPNKNNKCGGRSESPQNGYCMVGVIFNNK
jgi:hypothetical protein